MSERSLRRRLGVAATALIALALAGAGLIVIFDHVLDRHAAADLDGTARFLAGQVTISGDGSPVLASTPPDPRYAEPYGGLYWQVVARGKDLRSRSLWDHRLVPPPDLVPGSAARRLDLVGPDGGRLLAAALAITVGHRDGGTPVTIMTALDRRDLVHSRDTYLGLLVPSLLGLGLVLSMAMWVFVHRALRPFRALRADLQAVRDGTRAGLPDHFPDEVQPLVDDLDRLLSFQDKALQRARRQGGDMAHGLAGVGGPAQGQLVAAARARACQQSRLSAAGITLIHPSIRASSMGSAKLAIWGGLNPTADLPARSAAKPRTASKGTIFPEGKSFGGNTTGSPNQPSALTARRSCGSQSSFMSWAALWRPALNAATGPTI